MFEYKSFIRRYSTGTYKGKKCDTYIVRLNYKTIARNTKLKSFNCGKYGNEKAKAKALEMFRNTWGFDYPFPAEI